MSLVRFGSRILAAILALSAATASHAGPAGHAFTYQGRLDQNGSPASGSFDFSFKLYASPSALIYLAGPVEVLDVPVADGLFKVKINFGDGMFNGSERWLSISVKPHGAAGYTVISPRQELTPAPYAMSAAEISLPLAQTGDTDAGGFFPTGLLSLTQYGTSNAILGQTSSTGAGVAGYAHAAGGVGVYGKSNVATAGKFENTSAANNSAALYVTSNGTGGAVASVSTGAGSAVAGWNDSGLGHAGFFSIFNGGSDKHAVHAESNSATGAALYGKNTGGGAALMLGAGTIRSPGSGINTPSAIFVHRATASSLSGVSTYINHPMCNGDPWAILFVTYRFSTPGSESVQDWDHVGVWYDSNVNKWAIFNANASDMEAGTAFNVMVIKQ